jgi:hypothetical protein
MLKQLIAVVLCTALVTSGCASAGGGRIAQDPQTAPVDRGVLADYVKQIPAGSKVRIERTTGGSLRGTLLRSTADSVTVQRNTRVPEPPVDVPFASITRLTLDTGGTSVGKTVAIAVGAGVGATFGILILLAALLGD